MEVVKRVVKITCPYCGRIHDLLISEHGRYTVECGNHTIVIYVDEDLMVRDIQVALRGTMLPFSLEIDDKKVKHAPSFVNMNRVKKIISGEISATDNDMLVIDMLIQLGILKRKREERGGDVE